MGNPLQYEFSDLYDHDKSNGKLKCWTMMQKINNCCFVLLFIGAVAVSIVLALHGPDEIKTINSYYSPIPLKEKVISIEDMALNYMVFLRYNKDQNSNQIFKNKEALKNGGRRLQAEGSSTLDKFGGTEFGGVVAGGLSDKELIDELCNGIRLAILEEQSIGNYLFVPDCRVLVQESSVDDDNGRVVVYNSFSKFQAYRLDNIDADKLKIADLKNA